MQQVSPFMQSYIESVQSGRVSADSPVGYAPVSEMPQDTFEVAPLPQEAPKKKKGKAGLIIGLVAGAAAVGALIWAGRTGKLNSVIDWVRNLFRRPPTPPTPPAP